MLLYHGEAADEGTITPGTFDWEWADLSMSSVGEILRGARENQGRAMAEIAAELCITERYLRALEQDDLPALPCAFFFKSFARQYAAALGIPDKLIEAALDVITRAAPENGAGDLAARPDPLVKRNQQATRSSAPAAVRALDPIVEESNRHYFSDRGIGKSVGALAGVLLACSGFYAWWNRPAAPPATSVRPVTAAVEQHSDTPRNDISPAAVSNAQGASAQITNAADPHEVKQVVLNLSAREPTWIRITSDGKPIFSGILKPSQTKTVSGLDMAQLKVGNAGGLEVMLNGKPIGTLGASGQVREILFTSPDNYQILEPQPRAPSPSGTTL